MAIATATDTLNNETRSPKGTKNQGRKDSGDAVILSFAAFGSAGPR
jgi:hypothetical protein